MSLAALRRTLLPAVVAAAAFASAGTAGAQSLTATTRYAPSCGPSTTCTSVRFGFGNPSGSTSLFLNALTLTSRSAAFRFAPAAGGVGLFQAVDAVGPFGGTTTVAPGGAQLLIDFLSGGFPFELSPGASGYVELALTSTPAIGTGTFDFVATLDDGSTVSGTVTPEPATLALVAGGLALFGVAARRRRQG